MPKTFRLPPGEPLLNIASYARRGPGARGGRLTPEQIEHIRRTVRRDPEVMVKVLSRGTGDFKAVVKHLDYISRRGKVELETDDGDRLTRKASADLLNDWDLDVDELRRQGDLNTSNGRQAPKLVHKLMFSMPPGTPPDKVLAAVRNLAREEFWGKHRYAMALHTDEPHPHVHLVLKAVSEQGTRLNIKKATLRQWRSQFSHHLRELGVAANATERAVRGQTRSAKKDGIYRANLRGGSTYMRDRVEAAARALSRGEVGADPGKTKLVQTRENVRRAWAAVIEILIRDKRPDLAAQARRIVEQMPPTTTERELIVGKLAERTRAPRVR